MQISENSVLYYILNPGPKKYGNIIPRTHCTDHSYSQMHTHTHTHTQKKSHMHIAHAHKYNNSVQHICTYTQVQQHSSAQLSKHT